MKTYKRNRNLFKTVVRLSESKIIKQVITIKLISSSEYKRIQHTYPRQQPNELLPNLLYVDHYYNCFSFTLPVTDNRLIELRSLYSCFSDDCTNFIHARIHF